jgi:hypothetical protein
MANSDDELTISLDDPRDMEIIDNNMSIDLSSSMNSYSFATTGATGSAGSYFVSTGAGANGTWSTNPYVFTTANASVGSMSHAGLHVTSDAKFDGDIKWKGRSLGDMLISIEQRLAILVPDPAKLEHFAALKKAYEHYKTLEALCEIPNKENEE